MVPSGCVWIIGLEDILDTLSGSNFFSVLDMKSGYHQVEIDEAHKHRTAFTVGPIEFYEFNRLPFGVYPTIQLRINASWRNVLET